MKKKTNRARSKLSPKDFQLVLRLAGEGFTPTQIIKELDAKKIQHPTYQCIYDIINRESNQTEIEQYRKAYQAQVQKVPIFHKRNRLEQLQKTLDRINTFIDRMEKSGTINKKDISKFLGLTKRLDDIIKSAREEAEKRPAQVAILQTFTGGQLTDEELIAEERRIDKELKRFRDRGVSFSTGPQDTPPQGTAAEDEAGSA